MLEPGAAPAVRERAQPAGRVAGGDSEADPGAHESGRTHERRGQEPSAGAALKEEAESADLGGDSRSERDTRLLTSLETRFLRRA